MDEAAPAAPKPLRTRSVRRRIAILLIIPLLSLIGLWALASSSTLLQAMSAYNDMIASDYYLFQGLSIINDLKIYKQGTALITNGWAREFMLREDTLITAVQSSTDPRLNTAEHAAFTGWVAAGR